MVSLAPPSVGGLAKQKSDGDSLRHAPKDAITALGTEEVERSFAVFQSANLHCLRHHVAVVLPAGWNHQEFDANLGVGRGVEPGGESGTGEYEFRHHLRHAAETI